MKSTNCFWEKSVLRLLISTVKITWARKRSAFDPKLTLDDLLWPSKVCHRRGCWRFEHWNGQTFDWNFERSKIRTRLQFKRLLGQYPTSFSFNSAIKTTRICKCCSLAPPRNLFIGSKSHRLDIEKKIWACSYHYETFTSQWCWPKCQKWVSPCAIKFHSENATIRDEPHIICDISYMAEMTDQGVTSVSRSL